MSPWRPPHDDLVLPRLLAEAQQVAVDVEDVSAIPSLLAGARVEYRNSLTGLFRQAAGGAVKSLVAAAADYGDVLTGGLPSLVTLHVDPTRELVTPEGATALLKPIVVGDEVVVVSSEWTIRRSPSFAPQDGQLVAVDEFHAVRDLTRLERLLAEWSAGLGFVPSYPTLRVACVATPDAIDGFPAVGDQLRAVASVWGGELDFVIAQHDPRDARSHARFEQAVLSNRYRLLVTMSNPGSRWVWRMGSRFREANRIHRALPTTSADAAVDELASVMASVTGALPGRPTEYWGSDALARVEARVGASFALSERARRHLTRNRYPWPERMLEHVELLAEVAESWSQRKSAGDASVERLEEWARMTFELKIALHDKGIRDKDAFFEFEGQRLCNRPHVKVDDYTNPAECGRIYFGIDERPSMSLWRFVVDHIGLHDRS